ncbi:regulatory protein RecX [Dermatophilus congolensis]|uniref:regulatory protein RecX n=1 Tax=Dermatophilus congolensis TaxID=1863 RepID=UPI001AAEFF12|nr:regulatory protein RecX [Dermatophilus congolensis]MBO3129218.1 regulatory protein RecX [Dermatophilus congolensis]MBO3132150.1 regulatory protein RecX [Dermatophilus congolensis]MBO3133694.1 regulatory protein RecX [Dermatophilus congolensis]MBO3135927.1 regulatory protein RecX [Dermatophilus congolensis]MBO3138167.1 regulatory protein RecX [Dermatophilus congolensis]
MSDDARLARAREAMAQAVAQASRSSQSEGSGALSVSADYAQAKRIALRKLAAAPRSRAQLAEAITAKDIPQETADQVLDRLEDAGLVDDAAYAQMLVRSLRESKGLSKRSLEMELAKRGVEATIVEDAVEHLDVERDKEAARAVVDKKLRSMSGLDIETKKRRLLGLLGRRGYSAGVAFSVVAQALDALPEHARD